MKRKLAALAAFTAAACIVAGSASAQSASVNITTEDVVYGDGFAEVTLALRNDGVRLYEPVLDFVAPGATLVMQPQFLIDSGKRCAGLPCPFIDFPVATTKRFRVRVPIKCGETINAVVKVNGLVESTWRTVTAGTVTLTLCGPECPTTTTTRLAATTTVAPTSTSTVPTSTTITITQRPTAPPAPASTSTTSTTAPQATSTTATTSTTAAPRTTSTQVATQPATSAPVGVTFPPTPSSVTPTIATPSTVGSTMVPTPITTTTTPVIMTATPAITATPATPLPAEPDFAG